MELGTSTCLFAHHRGSSAEPNYIDQIRWCADAGFRVIDMNFCASVRAGSGADLARDDWERRISELAY